MASTLYSRIHADYEDLDNETGTAPGFLVEVKENDGGVGVCFYPDGEVSPKRPGVGRAQVFMTAEEARELLAGLRDAIARADAKNRANERGAGSLQRRAVNGREPGLAYVPVPVERQPSAYVWRTTAE